MHYKSALKSPNYKLWQEAMSEEINTMTKRKVWTLVPKPANKQILGCRWVYNIKKNDENKIVKYKARLVAQGYRQYKGISYNEVYSPVINFSIIRLFFSLLVSCFKWSHIQLDIKGAYLYAKLSDEIFMKQPQGFEDSNNPDFVCKLHKAIYGLHQSGREWFYEIDSYLKSINFKKFEWCNCTYVYKNNAVLLLYVDDIIILGENQEVIQRIISIISVKYEITILGKTRNLLGITFEETEEGILIHQEDYIKNLEKRFKAYNIPKSTLPIAKGYSLSKRLSPKTEEEKREMRRFPYRNILGCLSFLSGRTRPDITYAVNSLSRFQENPGKVHWEILLRLLGYVISTKTFKLKLFNVQSINISCFTDADFASDIDSRTSVGGLILFLDQSPIIWRSFQQKSISLSTMESEYKSITEAAKEVKWIKCILEECISFRLFKHTYLSATVYSDNMSAIQFASSPIENQRTKYIEVQLHFIRNLIKDNLFKLKYVNTKINVADTFTKPQTKEQIKRLTEKVFKRD